MSVQLLLWPSAKILQHCKSSYLCLVRCMALSSKAWGCLQQRTILQLPTVLELSPRKQHLYKIGQHHTATQSSAMHPAQLTGLPERVHDQPNEATGDSAKHFLICQRSICEEAKLPRFSREVRGSNTSLPAEWSPQKVNLFLEFTESDFPAWQTTHKLGWSFPSQYMHHTKAATWAAKLFIEPVFAASCFSPNHCLYFKEQEKLHIG